MAQVTDRIEQLTVNFHIETWNGYRQFHVERGNEGQWIASIRIERCPMVITSASTPDAALRKALQEALTVKPFEPPAKPKRLRLGKRP